MNYKEKVENYLKKLEVPFSQTEDRAGNDSLVIHILPKYNEIIEAKKVEMEKDLESAVMVAQMGGMNVVIVESNSLEA